MALVRPLLLLSVATGAAGCITGNYSSPLIIDSTLTARTDTIPIFFGEINTHTIAPLIPVSADSLLLIARTSDASLSIQMRTLDGRVQEATAVTVDREEDWFQLLRFGDRLLLLSRLESDDSIEVRLRSWDLRSGRPTDEHLPLMRVRDDLRELEISKHDHSRWGGIWGVLPDKMSTLAFGSFDPTDTRSQYEKDQGRMRNPIVVMPTFKDGYHLLLSSDSAYAAVWTMESLEKRKGVEVYHWDVTVFDASLRIVQQRSIDVPAQNINALKDHYVPFSQGNHLPPQFGLDNRGRLIVHGVVEGEGTWEINLLVLDVDSTRDRRVVKTFSRDLFATKAYLLASGVVLDEENGVVSLLPFSREVLKRQGDLTAGGIGLVRWPAEGGDPIVRTLPFADSAWSDVFERNTVGAFFLRDAVSIPGRGTCVMARTEGTANYDLYFMVTPSLSLDWARGIRRPEVTYSLPITVTPERLTLFSRDYGTGLLSLESIDLTGRRTSRPQRIAMTGEHNIIQGTISPNDSTIVFLTTQIEDYLQSAFTGKKRATFLHTVSLP